MNKSLLIKLVRKAQAERNWEKRKALWEKVREAGQPHDATVVNEGLIGNPESDLKPPESDPPS